MTMSKAILVVDMPENCDMCRFVDMVNGKLCCRNRVYAELEKYYMIRRPSGCPLVPLPKKLDYPPKNENSYVAGWNACIDALGGMLKMRQYINEELHIDGRKIPYPVHTSNEYLRMHDGISDEEIDNWTEENWEIRKIINQILAIKQSCFLLRNTTHSCQSLSDDLYDLKLRLIAELKENHDYEFDDDWVENQLGPQEKCTW